jgi:hypothetical protein
MVFMDYELPKEAAAPSSSVANNGKETAIHESIAGYKTVTVWKKIGEVTRFHMGVRFTFTDLFGQYHLLYICGSDLPKLIYDRRITDLVGIDESTNKVVINIEGKAFRSRSGKALCLRVPGFAGGEASVPWKAFLAVAEEKQQRARISILATT